MSLKVASRCNAVTKNQIKPLTDPRRTSILLPIRRRSSSVVLSATRSAAAELTAVKEGKLGERLRMGRLSEDQMSYKEKFIVRCYEVGINKTATVETIANLLQDRRLSKPAYLACIGAGPDLFQEVGGNHAQSVGFSTDGFATTTNMRKLHLIWVTARMHIEVYRYPAWSDVVEIETWCQSEGRIGTRRDWLIKDSSNGEIIGRATSKWVMMNQDTRRLQKVTDEVRDELEVYFPKEPRLAFPEKNNASLKKIEKVGDPVQHSRLGLMPRRSDLDMNQHVNNVTYIGWVLESVPQEIIDTHELQTITLDYRRECQHNDMVDSLTSVEPDDNDDGMILKLGGKNGSAVANNKQDKYQFLHLLRLSSDGLEINRGRTEWRKKSAR